MEKYDVPKFRSFRGSHREVVLVKGVLKICSKFITETHAEECDFNKVATQLC